MVMVLRPWSLGSVWMPVMLASWRANTAATLARTPGTSRLSISSVCGSSLMKHGPGGRSYGVCTTNAARPDSATGCSPRIPTTAQK